MPLPSGRARRPVIRLGPPWGSSSAGRAPRSQRGCRGFESLLPRNSSNLAGGPLQVTEEWAGYRCSKFLPVVTETFGKKQPLQPLPLLEASFYPQAARLAHHVFGGGEGALDVELRSEERRVGKECRSRWS